MDEHGTPTISTYIMNASNLPVFSLELIDGVTTASSFAVQEPTPKPHRQRAQNYDWTKEDKEPWEVRIAILIFTDAEGNRWIRDHHGLRLLQRAKTLPDVDESVRKAASRRLLRWPGRKRQPSAANDRTG